MQINPTYEPLRQPLCQPVTLSTGRTVKHRYLPNGAQEAYMSDGGAMTRQEGDEYAKHRDVQFRLGLIRLILRLALGCTDPQTRSLTKDFPDYWTHIGKVNSKTLKNQRIANALCDIHHCEAVRVQNIIGECERLLLHV